jgi:RNA ligase (TIGR02306 family)
VRKLASIQKVKEICPVFGMTADGEEFEAENVVLVKFEDIAWQCVAKKEEFEEGDLGVYIEISSVVPEIEAFEFLKPRKYKVSTARFLKTTLSQGLFMPLTVLPEGEYEQGQDVSETLGVKPWDPPLPKMGNMKAKGNFPAQFPKTDEVRIQSNPKLLEEMRDLDVAMTMKLDGTSATYAKINGELVVCSRNYQIERGDNVYWHMVRKYPKLFDIPEGMCLQGEIVGPNIQKNRMGLSEAQIFFFNAYVCAEGNGSKPHYVPQCRLPALLERFEVPMVPVVWMGRFDFDVDNLLAVAAHYDYPGTTNPIEGLVVRPYWAEQISPSLGGRLSFKVVSNRYLENGGE